MTVVIRRIGRDRRSRAAGRVGARHAHLERRIVLGVVRDFLDRRHGDGHVRAAVPLGCRDRALFARTEFQISIAFAPHWSSSQSQSFTQSVTGGISTVSDS